MSFNGIKNLNKSRIAEAGKIKIGIKSHRTTGTGYRLPEKIDHFLVTHTHKDTSDNFVINEEVMSKLPKDADGKVRRIPVCFATDDIDKILQTTFAIYKGRRRQVSCDGETYVQYKFDNNGNQLDSKTGKCERACGGECAFAKFDKREGKGCRANGKLNAHLAVDDHVTIGAYYVFRTTSWESINNLYASLHQILGVAKRIRGHKIYLGIRPVTVAPKGKTKTVYCCYLELVHSPLHALQASVEMVELESRLPVIDAEPFYLPPAAIEESLKEQEEVSTEFYPEDESIESVINNKLDEAINATELRRELVNDVSPDDSEREPGEDG